MVILKKNIKGFSLIEVSISLLVVGIISNICFSQLCAFKRITALQKTQANCDFVIKAIGTYFMHSDGTKLPAPIPPFEQDGFGCIPHRALGIMENSANDGFGNPIRYKLNREFGKTPGHDKTMGISEFSSDFPNDKVAIILKSLDTKGSEIYKVWYSENTFISMFPITKKVIKRKSVVSSELTD